MKRLIFVSLFVAGTLMTTTTHAQVYIGGTIRFGLPVPRLYCPPVPHVVYQDAFSSAPYYNDERVVAAEPEYYYGRRRYRERDRRCEDHRFDNREYRFHDHDRRYREYEDREEDHDRRW